MVASLRRRADAKAYRYFRELGRYVDRRWQRAQRHAAALPDIAVTALQAFAPHQAISANSLLEEFLETSEHLEHESDSRNLFGEPHVRVYSGDSLYIEVLYWMSGTTAIHEHAFTGAFSVLEGSSLHSRYRFVGEQLLYNDFLWGRLELDECEWLKIGAARPIHGDRGLIHSLFHLEHPSVSIVIRTPGQAALRGAQFTYHPPYLADVRGSRELHRRGREQALEVLHASAPDRYWRQLRNLLSTAELPEVYGILSGSYDRALGADAGKIAALERLLKRRFGKRAAQLQEVCREEARQRFIVGRRDLVRDPDLRFVMAVLLNVRSRREILKVLSQRWPKGSAVERLVRAAREILILSRGSWSHLALPAVDLYLDDDDIGLAVSILEGEKGARRGPARRRAEITLALRKSPLFAGLFGANKGG